MKRLKMIGWTVALTCLLSASLQAQAIRQSDLASAWDAMTRMFVTTARAMPAQHYTFSPIDPLATFGGLVGHTIGANYLFGPTVDAPKVQRPSFDETDKNEVVRNLEASFKYIRDAIDKLSDDDLNEQIDWFGSKMSRLKAILSMTDHVEREYGKVITYARLKGVQPARGRGW